MILNIADIILTLTLDTADRRPIHVLVSGLFSNAATILLGTCYAQLRSTPECGHGAEPHTRLIPSRKSGLWRLGFGTLRAAYSVGPMFRTPAE